MTSIIAQKQLFSIAPKSASTALILEFLENAVK
jgi:hypothetical protein